MARAVYKSTFAELLDDFYSGTADDVRASLEYALHLLESDDRPLTDVAAQWSTDQGTLPPEAPDELQAYWLSESSQLAGKDADRILRHGYLDAIRLALDSEPPLPIETFWITGAGEELELHVCEGKRQVTVFIFIPLEREYGSTRARSRSFAIRTGGLRDAGETISPGAPAVVRAQTSGPGGAPQA
jgi:hypothetical protein